ncbi:unnamed protein product, partial [Allacma fusca]
NEAVIGNVLKRWLDSGKIKREDLFILTKLPPIGMRPEHVPHFIQLSLKNLQLDYLDLYLVHCPVGFQYVDAKQLFPMEGDTLSVDTKTDLEAIWGAMEAQVEKGLARSIGISNFCRSQIERIMKVSKIQPANHQIELHAYFQRPALMETCRKHNITVVAYAPIGSPGRKQYYEHRGLAFEPISILEDQEVLDIAKNHSKTPAQILMKFLVQQDIAVIPKSTNPERLLQNFDLFNFELTSTEMERLKALDKGEAGRTFNAELLGPAILNNPEGKNFFVD